MQDIKLTVMGCKIKANFFVLAAVTCTLIINNSENLNFCVFSLFIHEIGHLMAMFWLKVKPQEIRLGLFGIDIIDKTRITKNYRIDIIILVCGSAANFVLSAVLLSANLYFNQTWIFIFGIESLYIGIFNALPIASLDGGQILFAITSSKFGEKIAESIVAAVSIFFLFPLALIGFLILLRSRYNFSLLFLSCYLFAMLLMQKNML